MMNNKMMNLFFTNPFKYSLTNKIKLPHIIKKKVIKKEDIKDLNIDSFTKYLKKTAKPIKMINNDAMIIFLVI